MEQASDWTVMGIVDELEVALKVSIGDEGMESVVYELQPLLVPEVRGVEFGGIAV